MIDLQKQLLWKIRNCPMELTKILSEKIKQNSTNLDNWFNSHQNNILVPLYSSVDLRVSENKIAPVDTNIFPAGFNNLSEKFRENAAKLFYDVLSKKYPASKKILIIPELHTKNSFYWENILTLKLILEKVNYEVKVGIVNEEFLDDKKVFKAQSNVEVEAFKAVSEKYKVSVEGFIPDIVLINNDFSEKCPQTLRDVLQPVLPPVEMGWHTRRKDVHFEFYNSLAKEVAEILDIDPWTILIETAYVENIDFDDQESRKITAERTQIVLDKLRVDYNQRSISKDPFVVIKSNSGTYGMAVMSANSSDAVLSMNASGRKKMRVTKGGIEVRDIVIQEGIPTIIKTNDGHFAEPVLYLVESKVAGAFYRTNSSRSDTENLNSRGMEFREYKEESIAQAYSLVARIASIACGYEIEKIIKEGGCKEAVN